MKGFASLGAALAVVALLAAASPMDDETPTIKEIMTKLHKGANAPIKSIGTGLKADTPDWPAIEEKAKLFAVLGSALVKATPPKGDVASWEKLAGAYATNAKALEKAAEDKDKAAATAAHQKLATSCMACHKAHRGQ